MKGIMKATVKEFIKKQGGFLFLSWLLPVILMVIIYATMGIYPGSEHRTILASDSFSQYANFFASFNNLLKGENHLFYSWSGSIGLNYWAFIAYYLGGIFTPLVFFFNNTQIPDFLYFLTILKIGCLGGAFWIYSSRTFKISKWLHVLLSVSYAMMSFALAHSEIIMWLDALMYLPLVILGINRLMDHRKPKLLFIAYLLLFLSNFYMAFMVGVFSFLYFFARLATDTIRYRKQVPMYFITSLLAGGASMIMILPTILDLRNNGEALSKIAQFKTKYTGLWDLIIKNMVGVYDSTKAESIPFIYVGLFALIFCLFYFVTKKVSLKQKISFGVLGLILVASFYIEPLNLFWQGMHTPNMFNFRFSFLFSFFVLMIAGYGLEQFKREDFDTMLTILFLVLTSYILVKVITDRGDYEYLYTRSFIWSVLFLLLYLGYLFIWKHKKNYQKFLLPLLLVTVCVEMGLNGYGIISGIMYEWHYPSRKYYSENQTDIQALVDQTKAENQNFYRLENLNPITANDAFKYGYNGISMFSSIRNRHSSFYLNKLGYRSLYTNLNIRYANNTLLMDSLMGVKYNLAQGNALKFGYEKIGEQGKYTLFENQYALPLGMLTDEQIYEEEAVESQASLLNHLADTKEDFFSFEEATLVKTKNLTQTEEQINSTTLVTYTPENQDEPMVLEWEVKVPANKQAYFSIYPVGYQTFGQPSLTLTVGKEEITNSVAETGQYYSLGYYEKTTTVKFKTTITGNPKKKNKTVFKIVKPDVALLDTTTFANTIEKVQKKGVEFKTSGNKATAEVDLEEAQVLLTTIPYDKGWRAYVDGKKVTIPTFKRALLTLPVDAGKHTIKLVFIPQGFVIGAVLLGGCIAVFGYYNYRINRKK